MQGSERLKRALSVQNRARGRGVLRIKIRGWQYIHLQETQLNILQQHFCPSMQPLLYNYTTIQP